VLPDGLFTKIVTLSAWPGAGLTEPAMVRVAVPLRAVPDAGAVKLIVPAAVAVRGDRTRTAKTAAARSVG
jgi:hypothetical protein